MVLITMGFCWSTYWKSLRCFFPESPWFDRWTVVKLPCSLLHVWLFQKWGGPKIGLPPVVLHCVFGIFHEINHPASLGYPHDYEKPPFGFGIPSVYPIFSHSCWWYSVEIWLCTTHMAHMVMDQNPRYPKIAGSWSVHGLLFPQIW
jgi:hypothetical protein